MEMLAVDQIHLIVLEVSIVMLQLKIMKGAIFQDQTILAIVHNQALVVLAACWKEWWLQVQMKELQTLIILQEIIMRLITQIKIVPQAEAFQAQAIAHLLLQEVVQVEADL